MEENENQSINKVHFTGLYKELSNCTVMFLIKSLNLLCKMKLTAVPEMK